MSHYTYLLINPTTGMLYIGKRSCNCLPEEDTTYMSSSTYVPKTECIKFIINTFDTALEALDNEIYFHNLFNVGVNHMFYNKSKQTSNSFDTTGISFLKSEATKQKISKAKIGVVPNWSPEGRQVILNNLQKGCSAATRIKSGQSLKQNGSNKGTKNAGFKPWFISTASVTYLFSDISKSEQSVIDGHYNKYYADLQKKFNKTGTVTTKQYGLITSMGFLPEQYKI